MSEVMPSVSVSPAQLLAAEAFRGVAPRPYEEMLAGIEPVNDVEQLPFPKQVGMLSKLGELAGRGAEWVVDAATAVKVRADIAVANFMENSRQVVPNVALAGLAILSAAGLVARESKSVEAHAQTCITASEGAVCTTVYGAGTYVDNVHVERVKYPAAKLPDICNYSAWFFYAPPSGGAYGLGYQSRRGCAPAFAWFAQPVRRSFPVGTQVCAKFYENNNADLIAEKCVGITGSGSGGGGW